VIKIAKLSPQTVLSVVMQYVLLDVARICLKLKINTCETNSLSKLRLL